MQCHEIMKRDTHVVADIDDVFVAARKMRQFDIGFLPVCDRAGHVVGVLTDRDVVLRVCAEDAPPRTTAVRDVMTTGVVTCRPTQSIALAERKMRSRRVTRLPIVDDVGRLLGVLSLSEISQYVRPARAGRTLRVVAERKYAPERP